MKVSELMHTRAVTRTPTTTVCTVGRLVADRRAGSIIVIGRVDEVAGIVTDRDITIRGVAEGRSGDIRVAPLMNEEPRMNARCTRQPAGGRPGRM